MYNKDDLLDSYFMANDYKETDIETATKNINDFIEKPVAFDKVKKSLLKWLPEEVIEYEK